MRQTRPQRRSLTTAFGAVVDWLIEPAEAPALDYADDSVPGRADHAPPTAPRLEVRPVVAVVGLARRCGATSVARGLGAALAARDPSGACAVTAASGTGGIRLGLPAAGRLARLLAPVGEVNACGRLCLVTTDNPVQLCDATRYAAPLVLDVGQGLETSAAAALADMVLIVCAPSTEPALARVVAESLSRVGPIPRVVVNRSTGTRPSEADAIHLPEARTAAHLAAIGREARGELGRAIAELADLCPRQVGRRSAVSER